MNEAGWEAVAARLSAGRDLTAWARACGAMQRARRIADGQTLLRLALAWAAGGRSLRQVALWAATEGLADLTDEALVKRFAGCGDWLADMLAQHLARQGAQPAGATGRATGRRLRIIDGSTVSPPGADKPVWRLLLSFEPTGQRTLGAEVVAAKQGELSLCGRTEPDDIVVADRNFARPEALATILARQGAFIVRLGGRSLRLLDGDGRVLDLAGLCRNAMASGPVDRPVQVGHGRDGGWQPLAARLLIRPLPPGAAAESRQRLGRAGQREGYSPSAAAEAAAGCLILLTSLSDEPAAEVEAAYRLRWQVELAFKRLKSLGHLDRLPARSPPLARTWLLANLLCALLAEDFAHEVLDSPPSASGT